MTKDELIGVVLRQTNNDSRRSIILDAVDAYSSASNGENPVISGSLLSQAKELFAKLTNDERIEVSGNYCKYCGQNEAEFGKCYCAPCYDE